MSNVGVRFDALEEPMSEARSRSAAAMGELFLPLYRLLSGGGDPRLAGAPARGQHFSAATANGASVRKGEPIAGLAHSAASVALPLFDAAGVFRPQIESDLQVFSAVEKSIADGRNVVLQIMDSSKLGWRAPSDKCLDEISMRWPDRVQIVVDACQMRLGRARLQQYLDRGYLVIVTGSKVFSVPPLTCGLAVPAAFSSALDGVAEA